LGQIRFGSAKEGVQWFIAGWSSPVARQAHNLKVIGSNPIPATKLVAGYQPHRKPPFGAAFVFLLYAATKLATAGGIAISNFSTSR
jgi:hypothetical protein